MARMGQVCGALSGSAGGARAMRDQLDVETGPDDIKAFDWLQELTRRFESEFGTVTCEGLLGCDISTAEGFRKAKRSPGHSALPGIRGLDLRSSSRDPRPRLRRAPRITANEPGRVG